MKRSIRLLMLRTLCCGLIAAGADDPLSGLKKLGPQGEPFGYGATAYVWEHTTRTPALIPVCWEDPLPEHATYRADVQQAVSDSWEKAAAIDFTGWGDCNGGNGDGVRIRVSDVGPHTDGLGTQIKGHPHGMTLDFEFKLWGADCSDPNSVPGYRTTCVKAIAVHEFGHVLGLAHEQNRPDTPGECGDPAQGENGDRLLTPWDKDSVMNYCNKSNHGILSAGDVESIRKMYDPRI